MNPTPDQAWLYYVLIDAEGNHAFANTLDEHNANKAIAEELGLLDS
jgi:cell division protein YceG involved in septum cleavage